MKCVFKLITLQLGNDVMVAVNVDPRDATKNYEVDAVVDALDTERIAQREADVGARTRAVRSLVIVLVSR